MRNSFAVLIIAAAVASTASSARAQAPQIDIIDSYGGITVGGYVLMDAIKIHPGDSLTVPKDSIIARARRIPGVRDANAALVCCDEGRRMLYIGIDEGMYPPIQFNPAPTGDVRLPASILAADSAIMASFIEGVQKGEAGEDDSRGYTLFKYAPARAAQQAYVAYAPQNLALIRSVLHNSALAGQRAIAAELLPFAGPSNEIASDLKLAMHDPDPNVRNNAMRALAVIGLYMQHNPASGINVSLDGFTELLHSLVWTDRNKAAFALATLTETRDPATLKKIAQTSFVPLVSMSRWRAKGHATFPLMLLGRIAGMSDEAIVNAINTDREIVIHAAERATGSNR